MRIQILATCAFVWLAPQVSAERVPAYDSLYTEETGYVTLLRSDDSHTHSWDSIGNWKDQIDAPNPSKNYYVGSALTLNVKMNDSGQTPGPFLGEKLVVAGRLYDYGTGGWYSLLGKNVTMLPGSEYYMTSAGHVYSEGLQIDGTVENPVLFTYDNGSGKYVKNLKIEFISGADGCVFFSAPRKGVGYELVSSMPNFLGTIKVGSQVDLSAQSMTMPGAFAIVEPGSFLRLRDISGMSTVGSFSAVAGAGLEFSGAENEHVLYVTNSLSLAAGSYVKTNKLRKWDYGTPPVCPAIRLSAEAAAAGMPEIDKIDVLCNSMAGRLASDIIPEMRLVSYDLPDGEKSIGVTYYEVVKLTNNTLLAMTPFLDKSNANWTEANNGAAHFWSDGQDPSPEKDYYIPDSYGVFFCASGFDGHALILKGEVWFSIASDYLTIPLIVDGSSSARIRLRNVGNNFELAGTLRKEGPRPMLLCAGNRNKLKVSSALSGGGDIVSWLKPEDDDDPANFVGTVEFSGDNSAYRGKIHVRAGSPGDFSEAPAFNGREPWEPSAVSNVTLEVSCKTNLGGTLESFAFNALSVSNECRLVLRETATFDEMSRGWLFGERAYLKVPAGKNATVKNRITYGTEVVKEGSGTLTLASKPWFLSNGDSVETSNGARLTVAEGRLGVAAADALVGLSVEFAAGTGLVLPIEGVGDGRGVDLTDVTVSAPHGIPVFFDTAALPEWPMKPVVTPVCTILADSQLLASLRTGKKAYKGTRTTFVPQSNGDGTVTVNAVTEYTGLRIIVR